MQKDIRVDQWTIIHPIPSICRVLYVLYIPSGTVSLDFSVPPETCNLQDKWTHLLFAFDECFWLQINQCKNTLAIWASLGDA